MIKLVNILNEGVYDPGIFKAAFTAGGPGSGKSYTASNLFGMPEKMPFVSADGLKGVNSDSVFEASGSLAEVKKEIENLEPVIDSQISVQFLAKKIDELVEEVNNLKTHN